MLEKFLELILKLPNLEHYLVFTNDGTILQTSFQAPSNVPKMGENLSGITSLFDKVLEYGQFHDEKVQRRIIMTNHHVFAIEMVDQRTNACLVFKWETFTPEAFYDLVKLLEKFEIQILETFNAELVKKARHEFAQVVKS